MTTTEYIMLSGAMDQYHRRRRPRIFALFVSHLLVALLAAINLLNAQDATIKSLSPLEFVDIVLKYHPVVRLSDINVEKARADILVARAGFDPVLEINRSKKVFGGTEYYEMLQPELRIPTWYGVELVAGASYWDGDRTNPERSLGETSFAGVVVPLAKDLWMDKRRAALQTARKFRELTETERRGILNNLWMEAVKAYLDWSFQYQQYQVILDAVRTSRERLRLISAAVGHGERPALDTIEALTQVQYFQSMLNDANTDFRNAGLEVATFLWTENNLPYGFSTAIVPDTRWLEGKEDLRRDIPSLDDLLIQAAGNHPDLMAYPLKLDILGIEKKLKFQELLPKINFKYNQLGKGYNILNAESGPLFASNFQFGLGLSVPLRLSRGRGEYRKAKLKLEETRLERDLKQQQVENKIRASYNELLNQAAQWQLLDETYQNFKRIQRGEEVKFFNGESSLFLVNSREIKTLESQLKLVKARVAFFKSKASLYWSAGILNQDVTGAD